MYEEKRPLKLGQRRMHSGAFQLPTRSLPEQFNRFLNYLCLRVIATLPNLLNSIQQIVTTELGTVAKILIIAREHGGGQSRIAG